MDLTQLLEAILEHPAQRLCYDVSGDEVWGIKRTFCLAARRRLRADDFAGAFNLTENSFQIRNRLLEDVPENFDVDQLAPGLGTHFTGDLKRRPEIVGGQIAEVTAHFIRHGERIKRARFSK